MTVVPDSAHTLAGVHTQQIAPLFADRFTAAGATTIHETVVATIGVTFGHVATIDLAVLIANAVALLHTPAIDGTPIDPAAIDITNRLITAAAVVAVTISAFAS